jgi:ABC-type multidrug transport system fused ATPase/permease subunit
VKAINCSMNIRMVRTALDLLESRHRRQAKLLFGAMVIGMLLEMLGIGVIIPLMLLVSGSESTQIDKLLPVFTQLVTREWLIVLGLGSLGLLYLLKNAFLAFLVWRQTEFVFGVQASLSCRLFALYLAMPYTFHLQHNSAQLIRNAVGEVKQFTFSLLFPALLFLAEILVALGLVAVLIYVEPFGALLTLFLLGGFGWIFQRATAGSLQRWGLARQLHEGRLVQHLQQGLGGVKEIKIFGREQDFLHSYGFNAKRNAEVGQRHLAMTQLPRLGVEMLAVLGLITLISFLVLQGRRLDDILPVVGIFIAAAFRLMPSINRMLNALQNVRFALPVLELLKSELAVTQPPLETPLPVGKSIFSEKLDFENVVYRYPGADRDALNLINLSICCGDSIGFIGGSGSGKSTLIDVGLGLFEPQSGRVTVDGVDIKTMMRDWQNKIGYVPQSIFLLDDSLRNNIAFGVALSRIDEQAVWRALRAAQLEDLVFSLPEGLDTEVGERGIRLSGGQRQRIGIARALYHDPEVLVLDEATSALDLATEAEVLDSVRTLSGAKTVIVVAHRIETLRHCNRIFRLEKGELVESGSYHEIIAMIEENRSVQ